jgi:hypothetical protein
MQGVAVQQWQGYMSHFVVLFSFSMYVCFLFCTFATSVFVEFFKLSSLALSQVGSMTCTSSNVADRCVVPDD